MTTPPTPEPSRGLDHVVALQSAICRLSAEDGRLAYRGYDVRELAEKSSFEETAFLLLVGHLPTGSELRQFTADLRSRQKLSPAGLRVLKSAAAGAEPMAVFRSALGTLALEQAVPLPPSREAALAQGLRLIAVAPTLVAAFHRLRSGQKPVLPRKSLSFAANFLAMLTDQPVAPEAARAFEAALILRAENELNPSTFAARVVASTGADGFAAVLAAAAALGGPRHGGHTRNVMRALEEIGTPDGVSQWLRAQRDRQARIPGFGHVVYQGEDPRTALLRGLAEQECQRAGLWTLFRTARELELAVERETGQHAIVDFYLAPLYRALGIPTDLFTAVFAVSRMPGWVAHVLEQYGDEHLIRPRAAYTGPLDLEYRPLRSRR